MYISSLAILTQSKPIVSFGEGLLKGFLIKLSKVERIQCSPVDGRASCNARGSSLLISPRIYDVTRKIRGVQIVVVFVAWQAAPAASKTVQRDSGRNDVDPSQKRIVSEEARRGAP